MEPDDQTEESGNDKTGSGVPAIMAGVALILGLILLVNRNNNPDGLPESGLSGEPAETDHSKAAAPAKKHAGNYSTHQGFTNLFNADSEVTFWWGKVPEQIRAAAVDTGTNSNIRMADYTGPEACAKCHPENFETWSSHSHRWMNAQAVPAHVKGDFSGQAKIEYQGGTGTFFKSDGRFRMKLVRDATIREYEIDRTIGSRFFQYYTGRLITGADTEPDNLRRTEHVLPFGYWIDSREWVPTVHVYRDTDYYDDARDVFTDHEIAPYDSGCAICHVTSPFGDWLADDRGGKRMSAYSPRSVAFDIAGYLKSEHPDLLPPSVEAATLNAVEQDDIRTDIAWLSHQAHGIAYGVTCESCHHGGKAHATHSTATTTSQKPWFSPVNPHLHSLAGKSVDLSDRSTENVNLICARCHSGGRKPYANGIHTWNSTEFTDGSHGFCYTRRPDSNSATDTLTCITCHSPHEGLGKGWKQTPKQDSQICVSCHDKFDTDTAVAAHTHHAAGSTGSQCMNCHMPKITEGLERMVRTHRIFNPTDRSMIEANQPNACNLCHLDQPIDWTIGHLREWYGPEHKYSERALLQNYPNRTGPVGPAWLQSPHHPTRLAATEALVAHDLAAALPRLLGVLVEDSNIINRQFTQKRIDESLGIRLRDLGYQFYFPEKQRRAVIQQIRPRLAGLAAKKPAGQGAN